MLTERLNVLLTVALMTAPMQAQAVDPLVLQNALAINLPAKAADALDGIPEPGPKLLAAEVITAH